MKKGFTLVEMLVVIGILAVLTSAGVAGYSRAIASAQRAKCNELVQNFHAALEQVLQTRSSWPKVLLDEFGGKEGKATKEVGAYLGKNGYFMFGRKNEGSDDLYLSKSESAAGVVSPWAEAVVKQRIGSGSVSDGMKIPTGGTLVDHRLRFALDDDYDGVTRVPISASGSGNGGAEVRAIACVWSCGQDGKFGTKDDVYSWSKDQERGR